MKAGKHKKGWGGEGKSIAREITERRAFVNSMSESEYEKATVLADRLAARIHARAVRARAKTRAKSARKVA